jgi:hypothetical protein
MIELLLQHFSREKLLALMFELEREGYIRHSGVTIIQISTGYMVQFRGRNPAFFDDHLNLVRVFRSK